MGGERRNATASLSLLHPRLTRRLGGRGSTTSSEGGAEAKGVLLAFLGTRFLALALLPWVRRSSGRGCPSFRLKPLISQACLIVVPPPPQSAELIPSLRDLFTGGWAGRLHPRPSGCFCRTGLVEEKMREQPVRPGGHLGQSNVGLAGGKASGTTKPGAILLKADLDDGKGS